MSPLSESAPIVNDFDVLGVASLRRQALQAFAGSAILRLHPALGIPQGSVFYEHALQEVKAWLRPQRLEESSEQGQDFIQTILEEDFARQFPLSKARLGDTWRSQLAAYTSAVPWQGGLRTAHFRYFPTWLREQGQDATLAQREWLRAFVSFADFGYKPFHELHLNPSLQIFSWVKALELPEMATGLYALAAVPAQKKLQEIELDACTASLIDLLQEERKFSRAEQLVDQALLLDLPKKWAREEWLKKLSNLIEQGIIAGSRSDT